MHTPSPRQQKPTRPATAFTRKQQTRLTALIVERVRDNGTIGAVERLAGIQGEAARAALWMPLTQIDKLHGVQAFLDAGMAHCRAIIARDRIQWVAL